MHKHRFKKKKKTGFGYNGAWFFRVFWKLNFENPALFLFFRKEPVSVLKKILISNCWFGIDKPFPFNKSRLEFGLSISKLFFIE